MKARNFLGVVFLISFSCLGLVGQSASASAPSLEGSFGHLPFIFEANRGQVRKTVDFIARGSDYSVLLEREKTEIVLAAPRFENEVNHISSASIVTIEFIGANRNAQFEAGQTLPGKSNYIVGKESSRWLFGIPQYGAVTQKSVYRGVDLVYYGNAGNLEYDFVLAPGSNPHSLAFRIQGAEDIEVSDSGDLVLRTEAGTVRLQKPAIYQRRGKDRRDINGKFVLRAVDEVGVAVDNYDVHSPLIIDPVLSFSTLIGANNNTQVQGIAVDSSKNVIIAGTTLASDYPVVNAYQPTNHGTTNVFVTKLNPGGNKILYSTYIGSSGFDNAAAIAVDSTGAAYVTGVVGAADFPTTPGAFMTSCSITCYTAFITKFLSDGSLAFSTFMGGSNSPAHSIAVDAAGEAYIVGTGGSPDFPTTAGAFQTSCPSGNCAYVQKLNASGSGLVYSTYFGGTSSSALPASTIGSAIAVDTSGSAYLAGSSNAIPVQNAIQPGVVGGPNAFIAKLSPDGSSLLFSTYLGGTSPFFFSYGGDFATGVAVDSNDNVHIVGTTSSCEFPLSLNALSTDCVTTGYDQKVFVASLNSSGSQLLFSTLLQSGFSAGIGVDSKGNSYVTGTTTSSNGFIMNPIESSFQNASSMGFVTEVDPAGKLLFSTYLGASYGSAPAAIAIDHSGGIYVTGAGQGDFPILNPIQSQIFQNTYYTFFVAKISPSNVPQFSLSPRVSPLLTLRNVSSVPLTISSIVPSSNFTMGGTCAGTMAPGGSCNLILLGANDKKKLGSVTITSNAHPKPQTIGIRKSPTGDGLGYSVSILPTYVQFPPQLIGTSSAAQEIVIQNQGLPAAVNDISIIQPAAFAQTNNCPALLDTGASCAISVIYTAATTQDGAQLAIVTDPFQTRYTVFLNGTGSPSALVVSTPAMEFGSQAGGSTSLGRIVNVINATSNPATVTGLSTSTGYSEIDNCSAALPPHGECRVSVAFAATGNQDAPGTLTISNYGPGGPETVSLHATGVQPGDLSLSPNSLDFPLGYIGIGANNPVIVTNNSKNTVSITNIGVTGTFTQTNTCSGSLSPFSSCQISVSFKPTSIGTVNGSLQVDFAGNGSPQIMPLSGTGGTVVQFYPSAIDFGSQLVNTSGSLSFSLDNPGTTAVTLGSFTVQNSEFKITQNNCGSSLARNTGCFLTLAFTPSASGPRTGTISVTASDYSQPHVAALQGTGISSGIGALSATSITFPPQSLGMKSSAHKVTLKNTGSGTLTINSITVSPQFFTKTTGCGKTLLPQGSCAISVFFDPTLQGILAGSLSIQDDGLNGQHTVSLSGTGQ